jgi:hypothetical protein
MIRTALPVVPGVTWSGSTITCVAGALIATCVAVASLVTRTVTLPDTFVLSETLKWPALPDVPGFTAARFARNFLPSRKKRTTTC